MNTGEEGFKDLWTHIAFWTPAGPGAPAASHLYVSSQCLLVVGTPYLLSSIKVGLLYKDKAKSECDCGDGDDFKDVFISILDCREVNCFFVSAARQVDGTRNCDEVQMEEIIWSAVLFHKTWGPDTCYGSSGLHRRSWRRLDFECSSLFFRKRENHKVIATAWLLLLYLCEYLEQILIKALDSVCKVSLCLSDD